MSPKTAVTAADLMRTDVLRLSVDTPIQEAVENFEEYRITGAPVVDEAGRLVGFLSLRDIATSDHVRDGRIDAERGTWPGASEDEFDEGEGWADSDDYSPEVLGRETVQDWMNPELVTCSPDTKLKDVCKLMVRESVHRVLVVEGGSLRGIVTTFDVVRHLADD